MKAGKWTEGENLFLKEYYSNWNDYAIAEQMSRSVRSIRTQAKKLGLTKGKKTYTLCLNVDMTFDEPNPWKQRNEIVRRVQGALTGEFLGEKIEVSCSEMQHNYEKQKPFLASSADEKKES